MIDTGSSIMILYVKSIQNALLLTHLYTSIFDFSTKCNEIGSFVGEEGPWHRKSNDGIAKIFVNLLIEMHPSYFVAFVSF